MEGEVLTSAAGAATEGAAGAAAETVAETANPDGGYNLDSFTAGFDDDDAGAVAVEAPMDGGAGTETAAEEAPPAEEAPAEAPPAEEAPEGEQPVEEAAPDTGEAGELIPIMFNGQEFKLSQEELVKQAQKGMKYDSVAGQLEADAQAAAAMRQLAATYDMTPEAFTEYLEQARTQQEVDALVADGVPVDFAQKHVELGRQAQREKLAAQQQQAEQQAAADFAQLGEKYPEFWAKVKATGEWPADLAAKIAGGMHPVQAYESWNTQQENEGLKQRLAALEARTATAEAAAKADAKNRQTAPGSAASQGDAAESDGFLAGFYGK